MNFLYRDHMSELNRQKIERDRMFILKEEMLKSKSEGPQIFDRLGRWMIAQGENLRSRYSSTESYRKPFLSQDESKILRA